MQVWAHMKDSTGAKLFKQGCISQCCEAGLDGLQSERGVEGWCNLQPHSKRLSWTVASVLIVVWLLNQSYHSGKLCKGVCLSPM
jgi:hypothetical protein